MRTLHWKSANKIREASRVTKLMQCSHGLPSILGQATLIFDKPQQRSKEAAAMNMGPEKEISHAGIPGVNDPRNCDHNHDSGPAMRHHITE